MLIRYQAASAITISSTTAAITAKNTKPDCLRKLLMYE